MVKQLSPVLSPLISLLIMIFGNTYFMSFLAVRMELNETNFRILGALSFAYYLGFVLGAFFIKRLIRRIGHIRSFTMFSIVFSILTILMGLIPFIPLWIIIRIFHGLCIGGIFVIIESWLLLTANFEKRGRVFAIYMIGLYGTQVLSQQILSYSEPNSFIPFIIVALICSLSTVPISLKKIDYPNISKDSFLNIKEILGISTLGFVTCFFSGITLSLIYSLMPYFLLQKDFTLAQTGTLMGGVYFGALSLQWPIGWLSDNVDRKKILIFVVFTSFLCSATATFIVKQSYFYSFLSVVYLFGGLIFSLYPLGMSQICDYLKHHEIVGASTIILFVFSIGSLVGPLTAPIVMKLYPENGFFLYTTIALGVFCIYSIWSLYPKTYETKFKE